MTREKDAGRDHDTARTLEDDEDIGPINSTFSASISGWRMARSTGISWTRLLIWT
jgi:hypothetical protein